MFFFGIFDRIEVAEGLKIKGKIYTQKELEDMGWELTAVATDVHLIFGQGKKRICWNSDTCVVEREYEVSS